MRAPLTFEEIRRRSLRAAAAAAGASMLACGSGAAPGGGTTTASGADKDTVNASTTDSGQPQQDAASVGDTGAAVTDAATTVADTISAPDIAQGVDGGAAVDSGTTAADIAVAGDTSGVIVTVDAVSSADVAQADVQGCPPLKAGEPDCKDKTSADRGKCCDERMKWCKAQFPTDQNAYNDCYYGPNFSAKCTGCIPWGPPAPPRFDELWRPMVVANGPVFAVT